MPEIFYHHVMALVLRFRNKQWTYPRWSTGEYSNNEGVRFRWAITNHDGCVLMLWAGSPSANLWPNYPDSWYFQVHRWHKKAVPIVIDTGELMRSMLEYQEFQDDDQLAHHLNYLKEHWDEWHMERLL